MIPATHPLADLLPRVSEDEFEELVLDIDRHGQREPATVWRDEEGIDWLIDGRHRADAVTRLNRSLRMTRFEGSSDDARALILSLNVRRRHLSASQRALAAGALATRQQGGVAGRRKQSVGLPVAPTQRDAAVTLGVSERLVRDGALIVRDGDDELVQAVTRGEVSVSAAAAEIRESRTDRQIAAAMYLRHRRSSASDAWLTPEWVIDRAVSCLGGIDGDVAAEPERRRVPATWWFTAAADALSQETWANPDGSAASIWLNPPYNAQGQGPGAWTRRVVAEWREGSVRAALLLLPARPGAKWLQELSEFPRVELSGHLTFEPGAGNPARTSWDAGKRSEAPFASVLVGVGVSAERLHAHFGDRGVVYVAFVPELD